MKDVFSSIVPELDLLIELAITGKFICSLCQSDATVFRIDNAVPKTLEMYVKPPISQLEDSISVMTVLAARS